MRLCEARLAFIYRFDGELLRMVADYNTPAEFKKWMADHPIRPGRDSATGRAALERRTIHIPDVQADPEYSFGAKDVEAFRTVLTVPMLKGDELLGVILTYRLEVRPFTDKQIALVETFADQAVIAIENVRLFDEVQARTRDLCESLQQQTATADVLKVISRSTFDLQTVLENACRIGGATVRGRTGGSIVRKRWAARSLGRDLRAVSIEFAKFREMSCSRAGRGPRLDGPSSNARRSTFRTCRATRNTSGRSATAGRLSHRARSANHARGNDMFGVFGLYRADVQPFTASRSSWSRRSLTRR